MSCISNVTVTIPGAEDQGHRHSAFALAADVKAILPVVPQTYRETHRTTFDSLFENSRRRINAENGLQGLLRHKAQGTYPPAI